MNRMHVSWNSLDIIFGTIDSKPQDSSGSELWSCKEAKKKSSVAEASIKYNLTQWS